MVRAVIVEAQRIVSLENVPDSPWWGEGKHHFLKEYFDRGLSERQRKMAFNAEDGWWTVLGEHAVRGSLGLDLALRRAAWGGGTRGRGSGHTCTSIPGCQGTGSLPEGSGEPWLFSARD